jgi:hypothetical protein
MAVAHDNDLQLIETMVGPSQKTYAQTELERAHHAQRTKDSLTGDAVENFLNENNIPVLLDNGGMCPVTLQGMPRTEYYFRQS